MPVQPTLSHAVRCPPHYLTRSHTPSHKSCNPPTPQDLEFTCEYKYDGERAQIHVLEDGSVAIYSRNAENNTAKYPDIVARLPLQLKPGIKSIVLDSEAVAWDREAKKILPFQVWLCVCVGGGGVKVCVCVGGGGG
jgi:DNA ligase-1